jgi:hypothetical protein
MELEVLEVLRHGAARLALLANGWQLTRPDPAGVTVDAWTRVWCDGW